MKYFSKTTYVVVFDNENTEDFDTKEEAIEYVQETIDDGDFDEINIKITEVNENNYASFDEQYSEEDVFECNAKYDEETEKATLDIITDEIGFITPEFDNYSQLMQYIDNHYDKCEHILDYEDFAVVKINNTYYYYEQGENDCDEFCKVEIVAHLDYDTDNDIQTEITQSPFANLFKNICCGEYVHDNGISYLWFDKIKGE